LQRLKLIVGPLCRETARITTQPPDCINSDVENVRMESTITCNPSRSTNNNLASANPEPSAHTALTLKPPSPNQSTNHHFCAVVISVSGGRWPVTQQQPQSHSNAQANGDTAMLGGWEILQHEPRNTYLDCFTALVCPHHVKHPGGSFLCAFSL
jgi:hypothetical protein